MESVGRLIRIAVPKIHFVVMNESKSGVNGDNHKGEEKWRWSCGSY